MDPDRKDFHKISIIDNAKKIGIELQQNDINYLSDRSFRHMNPVLLVAARRGVLDNPESEEYKVYTRRLKEAWNVKELPEELFEDYYIYKERLNPLD